MNLYLRLIWTLLRSAFLPAISPDDTLVIRRRVWPNDLDINLHMNNGRYLTVVDLSLIEFFARTGFLKASLQQKWRPMAGGTLITFRRSLKPLQTYEVRFRWSCTAGGWNYMTYEFITAGRLYASGVLKGGIVGQDGLVDTQAATPSLPERCHDSVNSLLLRPLTEEVKAWRQSEKGLYDKANERLQNREAASVQ